MVELDHIAKRYGRGSAILADVSLRLEDGEFCVLNGASGAGKTTLLNIIALAEPPSHGRMLLFGADAGALGRDARAALRRRIGIIHQVCWLIDELSARDNVALPLRIAGAREADIANDVAELLAWVGLADSGDALAAALSAGERQRVALARAIVGRPDLLLADEPTGFGGDDIAELLVHVLEQLNRLGTTVLVASNDSGFSRRFAHRRLHLHQGMLSDAGAGAGQ